MKQTQLIMGMPITVEVVGDTSAADIQAVFSYFREVDERFSTYKPESEISKVNKGLPRAAWSTDMQTVLALCDETKRLTHGFFDIARSGRLDPSGLVKGWAIYSAAQQLQARGVADFYIEAGGDIQAQGNSAVDGGWTVGVRNPFNIAEIVKVVRIHDQGVATSGAYIRGQHIYNPHDAANPPSGVASLTVIGPNIYEADRFATAAYAMGGDAGIRFIEATDGLEGYMINDRGIATMTTGFERFVVHA